MKFSQELAEESPFRERPFLYGNDEAALATAIPALDQEQLIATFRKSPMTRAKLARLRRK